MSGLNWLRSLPRALFVLTIFGTLAGLIAGFWLLFHVVRPAPPQTVTMITGSPGGAYAHYAERYRQMLAREGIELTLLPSGGSVENLRALKTNPEVELGFIQSGIAHEPDASDLMSLGSMYFEPLWIFHRLGEPLNHLGQLAGRRSAIGAPGSGTQLLALQLLGVTGIGYDSEGLIHEGGLDAAEALIAGEIDAVILLAGIDAPIVRLLLDEPDIELAELAHTEAYARLIPQLATVTLPAGGLDMARIVPATDIRMLGATADLVARSDLHPAIVSLLLQAAAHIHGQPGILQRAGEYPRAAGRDLPASKTAMRFHESGPSLLQRYLPFWLAVLVDRLLVALLPLIAILIPLMRIAPALYAWQIRSRIYRWYGELKFLEEELRARFDETRLQEYLERLDRIEDLANHKRIPLSYNNELYTLREHIQLVRRQLMRLAEASPAVAEQ